MENPYEPKSKADYETTILWELYNSALKGFCANPNLEYSKMENRALDAMNQARAALAVWKEAKL